MSSLAVHSPAPQDNLKALSHDCTRCPIQISSSMPQTDEFKKGNEVFWPLLTYRRGRMGTEQGHSKHSLFNSRLHLARGQTPSSCSMENLPSMCLCVCVGGTNSGQRGCCLPRAGVNRQLSSHLHPHQLEHDGPRPHNQTHCSAC